MTRAPVAAVLAALCTAASAAPSRKIAVTEMKNVQGVAPGTATIISDIIVSEVSRSGWDVISQSDIAAMIGFEKQRKILGCSEDSSCLAEIGGALGVDFMLAGQVGQIGSRYRISLLLVDAKKAKVATRAAQFCDRNEDALARAAESTVKEILGAIRTPSAAAVASPAAEGRETRPVEPTPSAIEVVPPAGRKEPSLPPSAIAAEPSGVAAPAHLRRLTAYITMGSGGAVFLTGAVVGLAARSRYNALEREQGTSGYYEDYLAKKGGIRALAVTADVLMVTGLAAGGVGGWLYWRDRRAGRLRVAILPSPSQGGAALVAAGEF